MADLNKTYDPAAVEDKWYGTWWMPPKGRCPRRGS